MQPKTLAEPGLVGRERELAELGHYLKWAKEGKGSTIFVSGEAGSGKTSLTKEFLRTVQEENLNVLSGYCLSTTSIPYFPFLEAFDHYFSAQAKDKSERATDEGLEIRAWLTGLKQVTNASNVRNMSPEIWKEMVYAAVTKIFLTIVSEKAAVFFVDDLHWADSASLSLLNHLSRIIKSEKVVLLATFRSEELVVDTEGRMHPLSELLHAMARDDLYHEIKLPNLNRSCVSEIAENMMQGNVDPNFSNSLSTESQGNALFVVETLRMLSERGSLIQKDNRWCLSVDSFEVPNKFRDIILRRLGVLRFAQRRILDAASVIGEKFDPELLAAILEVESLKVLEALNTIALSTWLVKFEGNVYRFGHAKFQEVIYSEIALPLKRGYHNRIAQKLESKKPIPVSDVAYHYTQADNKDKAVDYSLTAAEEAINRFSNAEAIKYLTYFLENTKDSSEYAEKRVQALTWLGQMYGWTGRFEDQYRLFQTLIDAAESDKEKLKAIGNAINAARFTPHLSASLELASKAEQYALCDPIEYARILWLKGNALVGLGKSLEGIKEYEAALHIFDEEDDTEDAIGTLVDLNTQRSIIEAVGELRVEWQKHYPLALAMYAIASSEERGILPIQTYLYAMLAIAFQSYGLIEQALESHAKTIDIGEKIGSFGQMAWGYYHISWVLELNQRSQEDIEKALWHSLKGVELAEKTDQIVIQFYIYASLTRLYILLGDFAAAEKWHERMIRLFSDIQAGSDYVALIAGWLAEAAYLVSKGKWEETNKCLDEEVFSGPWPQHWKKIYLAFSLSRQGRFAEANAIIEELQKSTLESARKFDLTEIHAITKTRKNIGIHEQLPVSLYFVNTGKIRGDIIRIAGLTNPDWKITLPQDFKIRNGDVEIKKSVAPFKVEKMTLTLQPLKTGAFTLNPIVSYLDGENQEKTCKAEAISFNVHPTLQLHVRGKTISVTALPKRLPTGFEELDALLFGGIPERYAVALASPSTDERELLTKSFLEAGTSANEIVFDIATDAGVGKELSEKYPSNFHLLLCNPQADTMIQDKPNIIKLKGVENLTNIDIALTKAFRTLRPQATGPKRVYIEILSDVLLQHHPVVTRKWLGALLSTFKSEGFTILGVIDPNMHLPEEARAVLDLFDGEIKVVERETPKGERSFLRIKKMTGQKYSREEILLTEE